MSLLGKKVWSLRHWLDARRVHDPSEKERMVLLLVAVAVTILWSGTFMGISTLQNVWAMEGHYSKECLKQLMSRQPAISVLPDAECEKQAVKLLALSSAVSAVTYIVFAFAGILTDWQGARRVFSGVVLLLILGNLVAVIPGYWAQFIGTVIISAASPSLAFTLIMWAQLYPKWTRWTVSIMAASIPAGSIYLGTLRTWYLSAHFSVSSFFALWLIFSVPTVTLFIIWPRGIGKPYAAAHPLLMLAHFKIFRQFFDRHGISLPEEPKHGTLVELEEAYANKEVSVLAKALEEDMQPSEASVDETTPQSPPSSPTPLLAHEEVESPRDIEIEMQKLSESNWVAQLSAGSVVCLQLYFLVISGWLAIMAALGNYRLSYWAQKTNPHNETQASADIALAKNFLVHVDLINGISFLLGPVAALSIRAIGIPGLSVILHTAVTATAALCMVPNFQIQLYTFLLFPIIRGLLYPFALMFLIQICGRKHLGLIWAITISGEGATDFMRSLLVQWSKWIYLDRVWVGLDIFQMTVVGILWIFPVFVWVKHYRTWRDKHHDGLT